MKPLVSFKKRIHFIGIGGIGISALARYFLSQKYEISGSDVSFSEIISELRKNGAKVHIKHKASNLPDSANLAIYSAAVNKNNPEVVKAKKLGIPIKSYSEALGELTRQYKTIAVAGTCGKSTTTAMLSLVFIKARLDPTVIIGTKLKEFGPPAGGSNFKKGKSDYLIIETDEHFKSFLNYSPFAAIITNIDRDHLDFYKNLNNLKKSFLDFIGNIQQGGILVVNKDDKNLFSLKNKIRKIAKKNKLKVIWYGIFPPQSASSPRLSVFLKVPGKHNVSNAMTVYEMARAFGVKDNVILKALSEYRGAWRRMEYRGNLKSQISKFKIPIYDDYAHHPSKIKAALAGFREKYPKSRIICVFQPHQLQRLKYLFKEFTECFNDADNLILLDVYKVKGRDPSNTNKHRLTTDLRRKIISSEKLAEAIKRKKSINVLYFNNPNNLKKEIEKILNQSIQRWSALSPRKSAIVVMMGAGDIYKLTDKLIK